MSSSGPGCRLPKGEHGFGTMQKNLNRPNVSDSENSMEKLVDTDLSSSSKLQPTLSQANTKLLHAVRALSNQVGALQIEQKALCEIVGKQGGGSPHKYMSSTTTSQDTPSDSGNVQAILI